MRFRKPVHLCECHLDKLGAFDCGEPSLNDWLKIRAWVNEVQNISRTYLVFTENDDLAGFFSLSSGSISHELTNAAIRRNMPKPIPVILLTRLAVDFRYQKMKVGSRLLKSALEIATESAKLCGAPFVAVHPLSERVSEFYKRYGFIQAKQELPLMVFRLERDTKPEQD